MIILAVVFSFKDCVLISLSINHLYYEGWVAL